MLHPDLIKAATQMDKDILEDEIDDGALEQEQDNLTLGSILDWKSSDQLASIGILYVMLALILVTNGSLSDRKSIPALLCFEFKLTSSSGHEKISQVLTASPFIEY